MIINKPHTWIELNQAAFDHNIKIYTSFLRPDDKLSIVIKSNAYGHGTKEIALMCQRNPHVDWISTASLSDALYIRLLTITKPILVLSIIDESVELAILHDIDLPVFDFATAYALHEIGKKLGKKVNIHVKIDTGMSRFGFLIHEAIPAILELKKMDFLEIRGIFTHCAEGGNSDSSYTLYQLEQFDHICRKIKSYGIDIPFRHASKSGIASTLNHFPEFNMVRIGAGAYGLWHFKELPGALESNNQNIQIQQIMTWKTRIGYIKQIPANTFVGYDRTYQTSKETRIAILPIGYYEGYDRRLSNQGTVLVANTYKAKVIGRVCMNATMIEIPEGEIASIGDEVVLLGNERDIQAHDIAAIIGSFNTREITTRLNPEIPRIVTQNELRPMVSDAPRIELQTENS